MLEAIQDFEVGSKTELITDEGNPEHRQRRRRRTTNKPSSIEADNADDVIDDGHKNEKKRKSRGRSAVGLPPARMVMVGVAENLKGLEEDIVNRDISTEVYSNKPIGFNHSFRGQPIDPGTINIIENNSQPSNNVFIQQKNGFRKEGKVAFEKRIEEERQMAEKNQLDKEAQDRYWLEQSNKCLKFALRFQKVFYTFCFFFHGLIPGATLVHVIILFGVSDATFLSVFATLERALNLTLYIILIIFCVEVADRVDYGEHDVSKFFINCVKCKFAGFQIVFYLIALLFNALASFPSWYFHDGSVTESSVAYRSNLEQLQRYNLVIAIFLTLGWFIMLFDLHLDRLSDNLTEEFAKDNEE